jgi:hypothetical protein
MFDDPELVASEILRFTSPDRVKAEGKKGMIARAPHRRG